MRKYLVVLTLLFILPFTVLADSYLTDSVAEPGTNVTHTLRNFLNITDTITVINFESVDNINITGVDLSRDGDNSVIAKVDYDNDLLTIQFKGKLVFPTCSNYLFGYLESVEYINGLNYCDTSNVTVMGGMFASCYNLKSLDLSTFDTSKVTKMIAMFYDCRNLISLDISNFNTSNAISIARMFYNCLELEKIDVSHFDTHNVTDMREMFYGCSKLKKIDLSNFDTRNVEYMQALFQKCSSLEYLDVSSFNTSKVVNMSNMFNSVSLSSFDVSNFDTSHVITFTGMFARNPHLKYIDLSNFDTSSSVLFNGTFAYCTGLEKIYVSDKFIISGEGSADSMFLSCVKLRNYNESLTDKTNANTSDTGYLTLAPTVTIKDNSNLFGNILKITKNMFSNVKELFSSNNDWDHNDSDIVNTGDTVNIMSNDNIFRTYTISYNGDTNGDGKINYIDYVRVYNHINNKRLLNKEYLISADYNNDNVVDNNDYSKIYNDIKK